MDNSPPIDDSQRRRDSEHITLLAVFHFVISGLALLGIGFLFFHYALMSTFFSHPERWTAKNETAPPPEVFQFFHLFIWIYIFMGVALLLACIGNLVSGIFLCLRKHRMFSLVIAGLNCLQVPFGTALGVFTIIVLQRDSVRRTYVA